MCACAHVRMCACAHVHKELKWSLSGLGYFGKGSKKGESSFIISRASLRTESNYGAWSSSSRCSYPHCWRGFSVRTREWWGTIHQRNCAATKLQVWGWLQANRLEDLYRDQRLRISSGRYLLPNQGQSQYKGWNFKLANEMLACEYSRVSSLRLHFNDRNSILMM